MLIDKLIFWFFTLPYGIFLWARLVLKILSGKARVYGWRNIPRWSSKGIILVANHPHPKALDYKVVIPLFFPAYLIRPRHWGPRTAADKGNFARNRRYRLMKPMLIEVDRSERGAGLKSVNESEEALLRGERVIIFGEGGRTSSATADETLLWSDSGRHKMRRHKSTAARLAIKIGALVTVVWIEYRDGVEIVKIAPAMTFERDASPGLTTQAIERTELELADSFE